MNLSAHCHVGCAAGTHLQTQSQHTMSAGQLQMMITLFETGHVHAHEEINVVPLIDVLLVLVVALLVAMPVMTQSLSVRVPQTAPITAGADTQTPLRVVIDANGQVQWPDGKDFSDPQRTLKVQADAAVPYEAVAKILAEASAAGMKSIDLLTRR